MALLANLSQDIFDDRTGNFFVITRVNHDGGSNTVEVPNGITTQTNQVAVIPEDDGDTAPSVSSVTQAAYPGAATVALSGGSSGVFRVITRHVGNAAALG